MLMNASYLQNVLSSSINVYQSSSDTSVPSIIFNSVNALCTDKGRHTITTQDIYDSLMEMGLTAYAQNVQALMAGEEKSGQKRRSE